MNTLIAAPSKQLTNHDRFRTILSQHVSEIANEWFTDQAHIEEPLERWLEGKRACLITSSDVVYGTSISSVNASQMTFNNYWFSFHLTRRGNVMLVTDVVVHTWAKRQPLRNE